MTRLERDGRCMAWTNRSDGAQEERDRPCRVGVRCWPMSVVVVGAGIVGLAVARQLLIDRPGEPVTVLDKENRVAAHQTGHNSGVVHAGIYYPPGSLKAQLCRRGRDLLGEFCAANGIRVDPVESWSSR